MRALRNAFLVVALALLAACAAQPPRPQTRVSIAVAAPSLPAPVTVPLPAATPSADLWTRLRTGFVLDDCGNPRAQAWAKRLTRNPRMFAGQLQQALPLIAWVQTAAEHSGVASELVLLPMVESSYNAAEPGRSGDPAGMWQIMPRTARAMGLDIGQGYDGRLDPAASTGAVMRMLKGYHDELHDWRLVDMAFNAGEYKMLGVLDGRKSSVDKPLRLPVSATTRDHLAKLMAMACIVRDPARFDVDLPQAENGYELTLLPLPQAVDLANAARAAGIPLAQLRSLNPGYRSERMPENAPHHLLLPQDSAQRLSAMLDAQGTDALAAAGSGAKETTAPANAALASAGKRDGASRHRVERGESLWSIARHYRVDLAKLRTWNALASDNLRPGQSLLLSAPD
ncbi:MAG TPA: transglycosylase SLT domain-containing protein [Rhodanobacteraceae bacterium]